MDTITDDLPSESTEDADPKIEQWSNNGLIHGPTMVSRDNCRVFFLEYHMYAKRKYSNRTAISLVFHK